MHEETDKCQGMTKSVQLDVKHQQEHHTLKIIHPEIWGKL